MKVLGLFCCIIGGEATSKGTAVRTSLVYNEKRQVNGDLDKMDGMLGKGGNFNIHISPDVAEIVFEFSEDQVENVESFTAQDDVEKLEVVDTEFLEDELSGKLQEANELIAAIQRMNTEEELSTPIDVFSFVEDNFEDFAITDLIEKLKASEQWNATEDHDQTAIVHRGTVKLPLTPSDGSRETCKYHQCYRRLANGEVEMRVYHRAFRCHAKNRTCTMFTGSGTWQTFDKVPAADLMEIVIYYSEKFFADANVPTLSDAFKFYKFKYFGIFQLGQPVWIYNGVHILYMRTTAKWTTDQMRFAFAYKSPNIRWFTQATAPFVEPPSTDLMANVLRGRIDFDCAIQYAYVNFLDFRSILGEPQKLNSLIDYITKFVKLPEDSDFPFHPGLSTFLECVEVKSPALRNRHQFRYFVVSYDSTDALLKPDQCLILREKTNGNLVPLSYVEKHWHNFNRMYTPQLFIKSGVPPHHVDYIRERMSFFDKNKLLKVAGNGKRNPVGEELFNKLSKYEETLNEQFRIRFDDVIPFLVKNSGDQINADIFLKNPDKYRLKQA